MILAFTVPGPPIPKGRPRVVAGHGYTPARTREYEKHVALLARAALCRLPAWNPAGPHELIVRVFRAARRGDLDNFVKLASDALNGVVWDDDRSVVRIHGALDDDKARPRLEVEVRCLGLGALPVGGGTQTTEGHSPWIP